MVNEQIMYQFDPSPLPPSHHNIFLQFLVVMATK